MVSCVTLAIEAMREEQLMGYQLGREKYVHIVVIADDSCIRKAPFSVNLGSHAVCMERGEMEGREVERGEMEGREVERGEMEGREMEGREVERGEMEGMSGGEGDTCCFL